MFTQRFVHQCVPSSIIHNTQKAEMVTDEWINEMWYIHTVKYYSSIKANTDTCYNMHEPLEYAKQKNPDTKYDIF